MPKTPKRRRASGRSPSMSKKKLKLNPFAKKRRRTRSPARIVKRPRDEMSPKPKPDGVIPLTPRVLIRSYKSRGFLDPPITIDETNASEAGDSETTSVWSQPKKISDRLNYSIEDGEILDNSSSNPPPFVNNAETPEIQILKELKRPDHATPRRSIRFKTPKFYRQMTQVKNRYFGRKNKRSKTHSNAAYSTESQGQNSSYDFHPNQRINTNFTTGLTQIRGGIFEFSGRQKRIVPQMGVKQASRPDLRMPRGTADLGMNNIYVPPASPANSFRSNTKGRYVASIGSLDSELIFFLSLC